MPSLGQPQARTQGSGSAAPSSGPCREPRKLARRMREGPSLTEVVGGPKAPDLHVLLVGGPALEDGGRALQMPRGHMRSPTRGLPMRGRCPNAPLAASLPRAPPKTESPFFSLWMESVGSRSPPSFQLRRPRWKLACRGWQQGESSCSQLTLACSQGLGARPALESGERVSGSHTPSDVAPPNPNRGASADLARIND